jgi:hypothetical protein
MKTRLTLLMLLGAATIYAGSVCFDIPPQHTPRVAEAFGAMLSLTNANGSPRPATQAEVTKACQDYVQSTTQDYERRKNMAQFNPSPVPITATPLPSSPSPTAKSR